MVDLTAEDNTLLSALYVKDPYLTVEQYLQSLAVLDVRPMYLLLRDGATPRPKKNEGLNHDTPSLVGASSMSCNGMSYGRRIQRQLKAIETFFSTQLHCKSIDPPATKAPRRPGMSVRAPGRRLARRPKKPVLCQTGYGRHALVAFSLRMKSETT